MRARWWLLLAALALPGSASAAPGGEDAGVASDADGGARSAPGNEKREPAGASQLKASLEKAEIAIGDVAKLKLEIDAPSTMKVALSEQPLGSLELVHRDEAAEERDGRTHTTIVLSLLALEPGELTIPALTVRTIAQNGEFEHLESAPQTLKVSSRIANEPNAEPKGLTEPVKVEQDDYTLAWVGLALLGAAIVALITLYTARYLRSRPVPPAPLPPPRPPWELAIERLERLSREKEQLIAEERGEVFIDGVSDAVREYLGRRYGFDGLESTTGEVLGTLERIRPDKLSLSGVSLLLEQCDLVKFARATPDAEQCDDLYNGAVGLVRSTTPTPTITPAKDADAAKEAKP